MQVESVTIVILLGKVLAEVDLPGLAGEVGNDNDIQ